MRILPRVVQALRFVVGSGSYWVGIRGLGPHMVGDIQVGQGHSMVRGRAWVRPTTPPRMCRPAPVEKQGCALSSGGDARGLTAVDPCKAEYCKVCARGRVVRTPAVGE